MIFLEHDCRWCGEEKYELVIRGPDLLTDLPGEFQFVKCINCGLLRQNPYLEWDSLKQYYPDDYNSYQPQVSDIDSQLRRMDKRYGLWKRVRLISKHKPSGKWVDIGAGTGRVLQEAMRWNRWDLMGVEPVKIAADYIANKTGLFVFNGRLENFDSHNECFDIVTMWDVLEHFEDPIKNLNKIKELLKPGGLFVFSIPNMNSWDRKLFKKYWVGYDLPRHLHLYPDELLKNMLQEMGFKIVEKKCVAGSHGAFILDIAFLNKKLESKLITKFLSLGPDSIIPRAISFIPLWVIDKLKLGSNITYITTKL
jgi:2-polyprenyl-3-methyl-5-hydroxy-6-metoxy-1,4-benzoquinol methylase